MTRRLGQTGIDTSLGKLPPQSLDLEEGVLGACIQYKGAFSLAAKILRGECFYKESHKEVFYACERLVSNSVPIDLFLVKEELTKAGKIEIVGGLFGLKKMADRVSSADNIEFHSTIILENYMKRETIRVLQEGLKKVYESDCDVLELLGELEKDVKDISDKNIRGGFTLAADALAEVYTDLQTTSTTGLTGVPSGFHSVDRVTGGFQKTDLIIVAAGTSQGKTSFVVSAMRNAAIDFKKPVGLLSMEMSVKQIIQRIAAGEAKFNLTDITRNKLTGDQVQHFIDETAELASAQIVIDDTPALSISEIRNKAFRMKTEYGIELLVVDYLQLATSKDSFSREREVSDISAALKAIAKELGIPVIALSQLSRANEKRGGDKRPILSDLRDSGSIEQDADVVMFLYRAERYGITQMSDGGSTKGLGEVIIAKHRNGDLENILMQFIGEYTQWKDLIPHEEGYATQELPPTNHGD